MRKRTKTRIKKTVVTVVLLLAVVIVQVAEGFALNAHAASEPSVVVNDFPGLYEAIIQARDGDIIGIGDVISISASNVTVGDPEKHITIVRMNEVAFLDIASNQATIQNITFDGNGIAGMYPMCVANYNTDFLNDTFQNCINNTFDGNGGAVKGITGNISLNGCIFTNNEAVNGGHAYIMNDTNLTIQDCTFTGGHASADGGGLYIQTSKQNTISNSTLTGNTADRIGGGILNQSALTITDSRVYSNTAAIGGADIANRNGFNLMVEHDMDALAQLFADLNLNPVEWVNDFDDEAGVTIDGFEPTVENTFLKLSLEAISTDDPEEPGEDPGDPGEGGNTGGESGGQDEPGTGEGGSEGGTGGESSGTETPGEDTGGGTETPGDDSGSGQGGSDDSGRGDSSEGQGTDPGSSEGGNDSTTDPTENPGSGSSDEGSDSTPSDSESGQGSSDTPGTGTEAGDGSGQASDASGNTTTDNSSVTGDTSTITDSNNSTNTTDSHDNTSAADSHDSSTHSDSHDSTTNNDSHSSDSSRTDNSRSSTTNDSHNSSVTNNYYTSENPSAPAPQAQQVASSQPPQVTVVNNIPSAEGQRSLSGQEQPQQNQVQQSTDNIRIEANGVNVVYEVIDGVHSISINSTSQDASAPVLQQLATESASEKQVVNWYEIAKVILLAGILVNLIWKRKEKD